MKKLLINGAVYTMDDENPKAEAVAIEDNKIIAVGTTEEIKALADDATEILDMAGRMVMPGLIDGHTHPGLTAFYSSLLLIDEQLKYDEILALVREFVEANPDQESYCGYNFNAIEVQKAGGYTTAALDEICSDKPLFIYASGLHGGWCNSKAFEIAGITKETPDPLPAVFCKNENGELTGEVSEPGACLPIIEACKFFSDDVYETGFAQFSRESAEAGITSFGGCGDIPSMMGGDTKEIQAQLIEDGTFKQRVFDSVYTGTPADVEESFENLAKWSKLYNTDKFRVNTFKFMMDGTPEAGSGACFGTFPWQPEVLPTIFSYEEAKACCLRAAELGYDIHVHAIGDAAINMSLNVAQAVREAGYTDTRFTNAHTQFTAVEDRPRFAEYNVIVNTSGQWHGYYDGAEELMGYIFDIDNKFRDILDAGAVLALGSDRPGDGAGWDPRIAIYTAMERKMPAFADDPDARIQPDEREKMSIDQCLKAYTVGNAYQLRMEDKLGQLKPGYYADITVFEKDMYEISSKEILTDKVCMTMIDGEIVYQA